MIRRQVGKKKKKRKQNCRNQRVICRTRGSNLFFNTSTNQKKKLIIIKFQTFEANANYPNTSKLKEKDG